MCCSQEFESGLELENHKVNCELCALKGETIYCMKCFRKMLPDLEVMKKHIMDHRNEINCPRCSETFENISKLNHHLTNVHNIYVNRRSVCRYCEEIFDDVNEMNEHVMKVHTEEKYKHVSHGKYGRMNCAICGNFNANSLILMQKHFVNEHSQGIDVDEVFYKNHNLPIIDQVDLLKVKKRGRPKLSENPAIFHNVTPEVKQIKELVRKRKRPLKLENITDENKKDIVKRGRPKKIKIENEESVKNAKINNAAVDYQFMGDLPSLNEEDY